MAVAVSVRGSSRSDHGALVASLYKAHAAELLRFAWHRLGRVEDAEDAVQATFLSAHRVLQEGERVLEPRAWLFRILRNECLTRLALVKRRGVHESLEEWHADTGPSIEESFERRDAFDATVALLGTLPEQQREAMVLREWLGLSAIETSEVLDTTPQGVDALVYRARKTLVAVPAVTDDSDCADVRAALANDAITVRIRAHLVACRSCRAAARRLRAPEEMAARGALPLDAVASRLGDSIPGFAVGAGTVAIAASGGTAAAATVAATAGGTSVAIKVVAGVAVGAAVVGGAASRVPEVRDAIRPVDPMVQQEPERSAAAAPSAQTEDGVVVAIVDASRASVQPSAAGVALDAAGVEPAEASPGEGATPPTEAVSSSAPSAPTGDGGSASDLPGKGNGGSQQSGGHVPVGVGERDKEAEKAEREADAAAQQAKREAEKAEREADAAAQQAKREAEKAKREADAAAQQAKREAEKAEREADAAAQQAKREAEKAEQAKREAEKAQREAEQRSDVAPALTGRDDHERPGKRPKQD